MPGVTEPLSAEPDKGGGDEGAGVVIVLGPEMMHTVKDSGHIGSRIVCT